MASHCRKKQFVLYDEFLSRIRGSGDISTSKYYPRPFILMMSQFCEIRVSRRLICRIYIVSAVLDVWSQKLEFATSEEPRSLDALLRNFYSDSLSLYEPSVCAVALVGWSLADMGIIWDRIISQVNLAFHLFYSICCLYSISN